MFWNFDLRVVFARRADVLPPLINWETVVMFKLRTLPLLAFTAVLLIACNRNAPNAPAVPPEGQATAPAPSAVPAAPAARVIPPSTETSVNTVESVMVTRPQDAPASVSISASGTVLSSGWTGAKLVPLDDTNGDTSIKSFTFVATSPATPQPNASMQAIDVQLQINSLPADVKAIRIVSATNEVSATVGGP